MLVAWLSSGSMFGRHAQHCYVKILTCALSENRITRDLWIVHSASKSAQQLSAAQIGGGLWQF